MSELAPGSLSLEESYEAQVPDPPADAPPAEPAVAPPQTPPDEPEPEGTVEIPQGKVVPLATLQAERSAKRTERDAREQAERDRDAAKTELDGIKRRLDAVAPMVHALERGEIPPQLMPRQPPAPQVAPKGPLSDQEAIEYARDLDLFKSDGTPDVDRAQRLATRQAALADRQAQAQVAPLVHQTARERSNAYFQHFAAMKDKAGQPVVDPAILREVWLWAPPELSSQENVAKVLFNQAVAQSVMSGKYKGMTVQPPPPPVHSEGLGGGHSGKVEPSAFERRAMEAANMSQKDWTEASGRFKPGERNSLE